MLNADNILLNQELLKVWLIEVSFNYKKVTGKEKGCNNWESCLVPTLF